MATRLCVLCRERPATVPDRNAMGRMLKKVCSTCHAARLTGDLDTILKRRKAREHDPE